MKTLSKKQMLSAAIALAVILALCAWIFGWGRGDINVMEFSANEVNRIELYCTDVRVGLHYAVVTEKDDIQALIDSVNSFQHTGSAVKDLFRYGIGIGGTLMYDFDVYLTNGETFPLRFGSNNGEEERSNMEVHYWVYQQGESKLIPDTCRGSMELFYELYEKYSVAE